MPDLAIPDGHIRYEVRGRGYPVLLFAPGFLSSRMERWRTNPAKPGVPQDWLDAARAPVPAGQHAETMTSACFRNDSTNTKTMSL
jgi:hypothetical protein